VSPPCTTVSVSNSAKTFLDVVTSHLSYFFFFPLIYNIVFFYSGFKRTLCGGAWEAHKNTWIGSALGASTARLGCCPIGSYMAKPEENSFSVASSCSSCTTGLFTDDLSNDGGVDDTSCKYCPKGYESKGTDTTQCHICPYSKVSCK